MATDLRERLLARLLAGPDPDEAPARLHRFLDAAGDRLAALVPDGRSEELLALLLGQSPHFAAWLARAPEQLARLASDPWLAREKPLAAMRRELAALPGGDGALRHYTGVEYLRLAARELGFGAPDEVGRELAALASVCLEAAVASARAEVEARGGPALTEEGARCRFVVFGMGKLGGGELNFSSDIDLVYLYETDAGAAGRLTLHEHFTKVAERVTRAIDDLTEEGRCFRVDLRLRPEGSQGPLVNSVPAAERYYEAWGRPWERQAWIKARAVAGDLDLGEETLALLSPFIWPRTLGEGAIEAVQALMARIRAEIAVEDDVKVGPGGIREIEFFVQALQLVHGGRNPSLRERGTLRALDKLLFAGHVSARELRELADGYLFLRRVEHRLQLEELRQTHRLPSGEARRGLLARRLGYLSRAELEAHLARVRMSVSRIYATLGKPPDGPAPAILALLDPTSERSRRVAALAELGFADLEASADEIELLRRRPRSPFAPTAERPAERAAPILLAEIAASPDPDLALRRLVDLAARRESGAAVWSLVAEHRPLGRLLMSLFGTSDFLAKIFVAQPELIEPLLRFDRAPAHRTRADHDRAIQTRLVEAGDDEEARLNALRRYRSEQVLRIGLYDVAGALEVDEASLELSTLAESCLEATLATVAPAVFRRWGRPRTALAVLGLGKLGGAEMSYSSDLDVVFLFGDDEAAVDRSGGLGEGGRVATPFEILSRLAQRLIHGLDAQMEEGRLYEIDTRLRPSGNRGALLSSLAGFQRYHAREAALWERQALIKARTVAVHGEGGAELGAAAERIAAQHVWEGPPLDAGEAASEIGRLRARMERELGRESRERLHIKAGRGGLLDVEFLAQYLQLVHGPRDPSLRARATRPALEALGAAGHLPDDERATLLGGYRFLRRLENRLRIVHDRPIASIAATEPIGGGELDKLARRLGYHGAGAGAHLLDDYRRHTSSVRAIYARYLPSSA